MKAIVQPLQPLQPLLPLLPLLPLAACVLCLSLAGCESNSPTAPDASDAPAARDVAQPDAASDATAMSTDLAPSLADAPSQPEVNRPDTMGDVLADIAATDSLGKDAPVTTDLAGDTAATVDLRAPALDVPAEVPAADARSADGPSAETSSEAGCSGWTTLKRLSPAEVADLLATSDPIVINVHIPYAGDIPGTDTSIPYNNVDAIETYLKRDHCADVVLVCLSGGMSQSAGNELVKRGYLRVRDLNGGMQAWEAAGYALLKDGGP